ncbi:MAG: hypothetical protein QW390_02355 [Candidatus Bathyarchaeia archaeon]
MGSLSALDVLLLVIVYLYVLGVIAGVRWLKSRRSLPPQVSRQMIHIFAGDPMLLLPLFTAWWYPFLIPLGLGVAVGLGLATRGSGLRSIMVDESSHSRLHALGPLYYVISIGVLVPLTWGVKAVGMAAVMMMAWGDGSAAALASRIAGRHRYPFSDKSVEGSLIMLGFSLLGGLAAYGACYCMGSLPAPLARWAVAASAGAVAATLAEALTVGPLKPFDNFTVPFAAALIMALLV